MWREALIEILHSMQKSQGRYIGAFIGFIMAVLILIIGFFKSLFIGMCVLIGYYIGKKKDNKESIIEVIERILPDGWK